MAHTPGPWRIDTTNGDDMNIVGHPRHPCTRYGVEGEWDVATVEDLHEDHKAEMIANARLIATAPDLLAALKYARRFLRSEDHDVAYIDSTIAKAEGRS